MAWHSRAWRLPFIQTVLERDLPQFVVSMPATALLRAWTLVRVTSARLGTRATGALSGHR